MGLVHGSFGQRLYRHFSVPCGPSAQLASCSNLHVALTRITAPSGLPGLSSRWPAERAFNVCIHLRRPEIEGEWGQWIDGRYSQVTTWAHGGTCILDLEMNPILLRSSGFDSMQIHVPRATVDAYSSESEQRAVEALWCHAGARDDVLLHWVRFFVPCLEARSALPEMFTDHMLLVLCAHLYRCYNIERIPPRVVTGGLAVWQQHRALSLLRSDLTGRLGLSHFARECGLSTPRFAKAFKISFGVPLHRYLLSLRVELAKRLMQHSSKNLADIAIEAGFSDQSALSRTFAAFAGTSPRRWRRENATITHFPL
jgi:AraC family transcriptional regulator